MKILKNSKYIILIMLIIYNYIPFYYPLETKAIGIKPYRIAHAGGAINNHTYTNSYEALNKNVGNGFVYFELDFSKTSDGQIVCVHNWSIDFSKNIGEKTSTPPSYSNFNNLISKKSKFTNCTLIGLKKWMDRNKKAKIITDTKDGDNLEILLKISKVIPDYTTRIIPQIYNPNNFKEVKDMGYNSIIWTLYRYYGNNNMVLFNIKNFYGEIAVTMSESRAKSDLPKKLIDIKIPSYVYTINTIDELNLYKNKYKISEIYTDHLIP